MKPNNPAKAFAGIQRSQDKEWLQGFRARMVTENAPEFVAAIELRLRQLDQIALQQSIGKSKPELALAARVHEAVRVYEEFLAFKHGGKRIKASRTRSMIERWGEKEAVRRTVMNMTMSNGLDLLAKHGRLDCAYEQIILDFPGDFGNEAVEKARANLAGLESIS